MEKKTCKIQFYFKRADMEKLLKDNPSAKGVIISEEIVPNTSSGSHHGNSVYITARADVGTGTTPKGGDEVPGCPYPPGCP